MHGEPERLPRYSTALSRIAAAFDLAAEDARRVPESDHAGRWYAYAASIAATRKLQRAFERTGEQQ